MEKKKKIQREHALLIVNGAPMIFHKGMVTSESYTLKNTVHAPCFKEYAPLSLAEMRTLTLTYQVSSASPDYAYYGTLKETLRILLYLFGTPQKPELPTAIKDKPPVKPPVAFPEIELPFSNGEAKVSWGLPASCAYVGFSISMVCCLVSKFTVVRNPENNSLETWTIELSEVNIGQFQKEYLDRIKNLPRFTLPPPTFLVPPEFPLGPWP